VRPILRIGTISCQVRRCGRYDGRRAGAVAERLGRGLQSLVQRFESAPRLHMLTCGDVLGDSESIAPSYDAPGA
jgi:hypothetical protein